jgi:hypothetical protein
MSPPRWPTPRPSSKSSDRNRVCSRMRSAEIEPSWASTGKAAIARIPKALNILEMVSLASRKRPPDWAGFLIFV